VRVARDRYTDSAPLAVERFVAAPGSRTALAGASAARAWGLPVDDERVTVVVPHGCRRSVLPAGVEVRHTRDWDVVERDGVLVTDLGRTLLDIARTEPLDVAVPVLDAGLRLGAAAAGIGGMPGDVRARRAFDLADPRAESPLESLLRLTLTLAGLPPADLQHTVREQGRFVARVDLWYPGVVVEADGFAFHRARADYRNDRRKGQTFGRLGLLVQRFSWENVVGMPDYTVASVRKTVERRGRFHAG
jgi:hypothetical protein